MKQTVNEWDPDVTPCTKPFILLEAASRFKINNNFLLSSFGTVKGLRHVVSTARRPSDQASLAFPASATLVSLYAN